MQAHQIPVLDAATGSVLGHFTSDTDETFTNSIGVFPYGSVLRAEDLTTGAAPWTFTGDCDLFAPPVAANGFIYADDDVAQAFADVTYSSAVLGSPTG